MPYHGHVILLPPNRVWRSYQGGRVLDTLIDTPEPRDSHYPEDWIASVTKASNPTSADASEGISQVKIGEAAYNLKALIEADPVYFLGSAHAARHGADPKVLVKYIDSAIRLHFQVHPTIEFARRMLGAPSGKTEAYHVLSRRESLGGACIYLGFRTPPSRAELKRMIEEQDITGIKSLMNCVTVSPGDTYLVPGGTPHALGEGLFLVEIQEPSDLVVRFEFERGGYVLPESARFMNRGLEFCLDVFDYVATDPGKLRKQPRELTRYSGNAWREELIGADSTSSFRLIRSILGDSIRRVPGEFTIGIVTEGSGSLNCGGAITPLRRFDKFLLPAGLGEVTLEPAGEESMTILECLPPGPQL